MSSPYELDRFVSIEMPVLTSADSALDIGCGRGHCGFLIRCDRGQDHVCLIGIDVHKPYLIFTKKMRIYDDLVLCDASRLPFKDRCFNLAVARGVIEHLPKNRGMELLSEIEYVSDGRIIITTPNGYWPQGPLGGVKAMIHRSQWHVGDFKSRGYKVKGVGFRAVKVCQSNPYLWGFFFYVSTPFSYIFPEIAELLIAVKDMKHYGE